MNTTIKPTAFMLIGVPGSGKSTWAEPFLLREGYALVSSDAYIERIAASLGKTYGDVFKDTIGEATKWMEAQFKAFTETGSKLIWDQTNLSMKTRRAKLNKLLEAGYDVTAVAFEMPADELEKRRVERAANTGKEIAPSILESMSQTYVRPTRLEGFKHVIIVTPDGEFEGG
jgi:predicted kinase